MVDKFLINLNRGEGQEEKLVRWRKRRESITLYSFLVIFIILSIFTYNNHKALTHLVNTKEDKIRRINNELDELQKQGQNVSKEDVMAIARLEKTRFLWTRKILALAEVLPDDIAVTGMEFKNNAFIIKFISRIRKDERDFDKIDEIMELLKNTEDFYRDFSNIKFDKSSRIVVDGQEILSFSVLSTLRVTIKADSRRSTGRRMM